jgi:hypothetical protein
VFGLSRADLNHRSTSTVHSRKVGGLRMMAGVARWFAILYAVAE